MMKMLLQIKLMRLRSAFPAERSQMDTAPVAAPPVAASAATDSSWSQASRAANGRQGPMCSALPLSEIVFHIRCNVARRITLREIAGLAQLSVFQLIRAFRRELAMTPYRLVLEVRIEFAKQLLTHGASIADAALGAGFADQSHFTRHFKRSTGVTPKKFFAPEMQVCD
jgi:AraC-like DNA-binding protein